MDHNNPMVYKSNALVEASYRLSVTEQRIILACISQVRRDEVVTDEVFYTVSATDLAQLSDTSIHAAYSDLKAAAVRLKRREVRLPEEPNGLGKKKEVMLTGWAQTVTYRDGEGCIKLRFSKDILPYLTELQKEFTRYALSEVAKMNSAYAIRMYELIIQWGSVGFRSISVEELREWLQLEERYPLMSDLRRWVIEPAIEQINEHTGLSISWKPRKAGRRITHIDLTFKPKVQLQLDLTAANEPEDKTAKQPKRPKNPGGLSDIELAAMALPGEKFADVWERVSQEYEAKRRA